MKLTISLTFNLILQYFLCRNNVFLNNFGIMLANLCIVVYCMWCSITAEDKCMCAICSRMGMFFVNELLSKRINIYRKSTKEYMHCIPKNCNYVPSSARQICNYTLWFYLFYFFAVRSYVESFWITDEDLISGNLFMIKPGSNAIRSELIWKTERFSAKTF